MSRLGLGSQWIGPEEKFAVARPFGKREPRRAAAQAMNRSTDASERDRALQLAWLCARELVGTKGTLAEITELLGDIRTLAQQEVDLLRRIVERNARK